MIDSTTNEETTTMEKTREFRVYRYWTVEMCSIATVNATSVDEATELGLEDSDFEDAEIVDGRDGPIQIGHIVEIGDDGNEIEHHRPSTDNEMELLATLRALLAGEAGAREAAAELVERLK